MNLKKAFKLLGNHNGEKRGSIIELTDLEASSKEFKNKVEQLIDAGSSKIMEKADEKVTELLNAAEKKAGEIIIQATEKASEIIAVATAMLEKANKAVKTEEPKKPDVKVKSSRTKKEGK